MKRLIAIMLVTALAAVAACGGKAKKPATPEHPAAGSATGGAQYGGAPYGGPTK